MKKSLLLIMTLLLLNAKVQSQNLYFPPVDNTATWETTDPASLGWCPDRIDNLYTFLEGENTKGFIILKDGKIVLEHYFGTFTAQNFWYWASAGKTITSFLVGKAQEENLLSINNKTSTYLGVGWTNCTLAQENNITVRNQLTMTSGLDDGVTDNHCTLNTCLNYLADSGTRWAYHNAPYTLLEGVLENATGQTINNYTQSKLKTPTGMNGFWTTVDYDNVYYSNVRSMARYGLLIQGNGVWNGTALMSDTTYFNAMLNTSQDLNKSYGYLWWLNGKQNFMVPTSQIVFPGSYAPDAPADMFAGIGKNGQIVSIAPSTGLVMIRMGDAPNSSEVPFVLCNQIWQYINNLDCNLSVTENSADKISVYPNPSESVVHIDNLNNDNYEVKVTSILGKVLIQKSNSNHIDISSLSKGIYIITVDQGERTLTQKLIKN
ncbi:serine hydrolase [Flavobacterium sp.]|uniref:serine hydrolase n=1 Tax=Flavobacterium sp. TaxID=239 RepID=UPI00286A90CB|nr:serine hydrolase [Flavobacterium sp.]